jgi:RNA polymerase sigma factor (sigma-70 family)
MRTITDPLQHDLTAFFRNDIATSRTLLDRLTPPLMALVRRELAGRLQSRVDPEDVCQSALGSFCRRYLAGEIQVDDWPRFWGLLAAIAHHKCCRQYEHHLAACRDVRRSYTLENPDALPTTHDHTDEIAVRDTLETVLLELNDTEQQIVLWYLQGFTYDEIASHAQTSSRTVRRVIARIRERYTQHEFADSCPSSMTR